MGKENRRSEPKQRAYTGSHQEKKKQKKERKKREREGENSERNSQNQQFLLSRAKPHTSPRVVVV
jgi:hypothetical protein